MIEQIETQIRQWTFYVQCNEENLGTVCITGDCESLGNWSSKIIIPLIYNNNTRTWYISLNIPADKDVNYRYFICSLDNSYLPQKTMIHEWETNFKPRVLKQSESNEFVDIFGMFDGHKKTEKGWLTDDLILELRLNKNSIKWVKNATHNEINVKIKLCNNERSIQNDINTDNTNQILISLSNENGKFRKQDNNGYSYNDVDAVVFLIRTFCLEQKAFVFELIENFTDQPPKKYFSFFIFENELHESNGQVKIPVHSADHEYFGSLKMKYLIIRPLPDVNCIFKVSYAKYWNNSWTGLEIGHRGSGVSFSKNTANNARVRENTISSFKSAVLNGAHLIEFDVQLTNDLIPIVYHDQNVLLEVQTKMEKQIKKMIFPFHKLTYEELKDFKIHHVKEANCTFSFENDDQEENLPFPSLEKVLKAIDPQIGFNIELKYKYEFEDGENEYDHSINMNEFVDKILQVVYANEGGRYVVFSSFNPDICTIARFKQNKYPVMFLTEGVSGKYSPYSDQRVRNVENAIHFANCADLLGIVAHSKDLLNDEKLIKQILNNELVLFCWGDDNNNNNNIAKLIEKGVHGIIFDRIDKLGQKLKKDIFKNGIM